VKASILNDYLKKHLLAHYFRNFYKDSTKYESMVTTCFI